MTGVRELQVLPGSPRVHWGKFTFAGISFEEQFVQTNEGAKVVATFDDGSAAAYECTYGKGKVIVLGTFAGEPNALQPVDQHPLGDILSNWAGLERPELKAKSFVELRRMKAAKGELVLLFNHGKESAAVEFATELNAAPRRITELLTDTDLTSGKRWKLATEIPGASLRVYRIDY
jgi:hypothetical protein